MNKQQLVEIGQRLRQQRQALGLTREKMAELADIGTGYYGQLEVGTSQWSREAPPCHIAMVGLHHPLREPDLHLSMYPALLSFGQ